MDKRKQVIEVIPYDPSWPKQFEEEASQLKPIFSDNLVQIYHIGSTSVPNLASKPTIDILVEVKDIASVDQYNEQMQRLGYEAWGEYKIPQRRFFLKGEETRTHHVHVFERGNSKIAEHLYFRDYLILHPAEAKEYAHLKKALAIQFFADRRGYLQGKQSFVEALNKKSFQWFYNQKNSQHKN